MLTAGAARDVLVGDEVPSWVRKVETLQSVFAEKYPHR